MGHGKDQHVVPHGEDWAVKGLGNSKATVVTSTKQEAIDKARESLKTKTLNCLSIIKMEKSVREIPTDMIPANQKVNIHQKVVLSNDLFYLIFE